MGPASIRSWEKEGQSFCILSVKIKTMADEEMERLRIDQVRLLAEKEDVKHTAVAGEDSIRPRPFKAGHTQ